MRVEKKAIKGFRVTVHFRIFSQPLNFPLQVLNEKWCSAILGYCRRFNGRRSTSRSYAVESNFFFSQNPIGSHNRITHKSKSNSVNYEQKATVCELCECPQITECLFKLRIECPFKLRFFLKIIFPLAKKSWMIMLSLAWNSVRPINWHHRNPTRYISCRYLCGYYNSLEYRSLKLKR